MVDLAPRTEEPSLPHWDVSPFFPSLDGREFAAAQESAIADVGRLQAEFDRLGIRGGERRQATDADARAAEEAIAALNDVLDKMRLVGAYLYAHVTTDARNDLAARLQSQFQAGTSTMSVLSKRFEAWV